MVTLCFNISEKEARDKVIEVINNGEAYNKFKELVKAQGGNISWIEDTNKFPKSKFEVQVRSKKTGFIQHMNTENIGKVACILGAGRETKDDVIDYSSGIKVLKKTSDFVKEGDLIAILYTNKENIIEEAENSYLSSLIFSEEKPEEPKLIYEIIK